MRSAIDAVFRASKRCRTLTINTARAIPLAQFANSSSEMFASGLRKHCGGTRTPNGESNIPRHTDAKQHQAFLKTTEQLICR